VVGDRGGSGGVADAIDRMLALRVEEFNVFVSEVAFA